jgi:hypothetical protein
MKCFDAISNNSASAKTKETWTLDEDMLLLELTVGDNCNDTLEAAGFELKVRPKSNKLCIDNAYICALVGHPAYSCFNYRLTRLIKGYNYGTKEDKRPVNYKLTPEVLFKLHGKTFEGDDQWKVRVNNFLVERITKLAEQSQEVSEESAA